MDIIEHVGGRQSGKTRYLAERVGELQDKGYDLVVVVTHDSREALHWYDLMFEVGIDPSRFLVQTAQGVDNLRGLRYALAGIDNADLMRDPCAVLSQARPGAVNALNDPVVVTSSHYLGGWCFEGKDRGSKG